MHHPKSHSLFGLGLPGYIYIYTYSYDYTPTCPIQLVFITILAPEIWRFGTLLVGLVEICWLLISVIVSFEPFLVIVENNSIIIILIYKYLVTVLGSFDCMVCRICLFDLIT